MRSQTRVVFLISLGFALGVVTCIRVVTDIDTYTINRFQDVNDLIVENAMISSSFSHYTDNHQSTVLLCPECGSIPYTGEPRVEVSVSGPATLTPEWFLRQIHRHDEIDMSFNRVQHSLWNQQLTLNHHLGRLREVYNRDGLVNIPRIDKRACTQTPLHLECHKRRQSH